MKKPTSRSLALSIMAACALSGCVHAYPPNERDAIMRTAPLEQIGGGAERGELEERPREARGGGCTAGACWMDPVLPLQPQSTAVAFCGHCGLSCCYADVDVVSVVWVRVGDCFRVAPVSLPATSHTHPWCTPSPLRPHEVLATSASAVVTFDGGGQRIREREEERRRPTPSSSSPADPRIQRSQQKLR